MQLINFLLHASLALAAVTDFNKASQEQDGAGLTLVERGDLGHDMTLNERAILTKRGNDACGLSCHGGGSGKGKCPSKARCDNNCRACQSKGFAFNSSKGCGCIKNPKCKVHCYNGCLVGCATAFDDSSFGLATCTLSCGNSCNCL